MKIAKESFSEFDFLKKTRRGQIVLFKGTDSDVVRTILESLFIEEIDTQAMALLFSLQGRIGFGVDTGHFTGESDTSALKAFTKNVVEAQLTKLGDSPKRATGQMS